MKGLILFVLCFFALETNAALALKAQNVVGIKLHSGKIIRNLSLQESAKVLKSLKSDENIEIRNLVIYPEEVAELIVRKLTKTRLSEKRPNPKDYN